MPVPTFSIVCTQKKLIAPSVYELRFQKPEGCVFNAGQFVLFDIPLLSNPSDIQARAYSLASTPGEKDLLFVIKLLAGGRMSTWVEQKLEVGSQVTMKGPFGVFTLEHYGKDKPYLFVCTGAGVAPFRGQIKHALESGEKRPMQLIFGVREKQDLFWVDEFTQLMKTYPNFTLHISLTSGEPDWDGHHGRVQEILKQLVKNPHSHTVFICGAPEMVNDVKKLCMEELGIEKANVHAEGYI